MKYYKIILITLMCVLLYGCTEPEKSNNVQIVILDVEKADAIIIMTGNHVVMIDTGYKNSSDIIINYLNSNNINTIDYLIISHYDKDHIGAAPAIIKSYNVKQVIQPDYTISNKEYNNYIDALNQANITPITLKDNMQFTLDDVEFTVYPPKKDEYELDNDYSIVVSMKHGSSSFLFAGDAMEERIDELLQDGDLEHTFLKVPHHGNYVNNINKFFEEVKPQYAVITCSDDEYASNKVILSLYELGTEIYVTSNGSIYCESDGKTLTVWQ